MAKMWWFSIVMVALLALGIYGFVTMVRMQTHRLSDHTTRTAADMYGQYADSPEKQRRFARAHGGAWRDDGTPASPDDPEAGLR